MAFHTACQCQFSASSETYRLIYHLMVNRVKQTRAYLICHYWSNNLLLSPLLWEVSATARRASLQWIKILLILMQMVQALNGHFQRHSIRFQLTRTYSFRNTNFLLIHAHSSTHDECEHASETNSHWFHIFSTKKMMIMKWREGNSTKLLNVNIIELLY